VLIVYNIIVRGIYILLLITIIIARINNIGR